MMGLRDGAYSGRRRMIAKAVLLAALYEVYSDEVIPDQSQDQ
jgi:hypothetical protein